MKNQNDGGLYTFMHYLATCLTLGALVAFIITLNQRMNRLEGTLNATARLVEEVQANMLIKAHADRYPNQERWYTFDRERKRWVRSEAIVETVTQIGGGHED